MKSGDRIFTYDHEGKGKYKAELIGKFDNPDYGELINMNDIENEVTEETT